MKKRFLALLMTLAMVLSLVPQTAYASGGEAAIPQAAAAVKEPKAAKTGTVLAFTSDTHNKSGNQAGYMGNVGDTCGYESEIQ